MQKNQQESFDRYNYVDRDIYSKGRKTPPKKKKHGCLTFFLVLVLIAGIVAAGFYGIFYKRMNYEAVDTSVYTGLTDEKPVGGVYNILLIGADRNSDGSNGRSDTMMLVSVDTLDKTIRLVSFMRDIYVDIPTVGSERLNAAFAYGGASLTMQTIEEYFNVKIDGYIMTDFDYFVQIIDAIGGIDLEISEYEAEYINGEPDGFAAYAGVNHLNGTQALFFARMRNLDSDFGRTGRQRQVIEAVLEKFEELSMLDKLSTAYEFMPYVTHNLSSGQLLSLAGVGAQLFSYTIETMNIPQDGTWWDEYATIGGIEGNMVLGVDFEANAAALEAFLYS